MTIILSSEKDIQNFALFDKNVFAFDSNIDTQGDSCDSNNNHSTK